MPTPPPQQGLEPTPLLEVFVLDRAVTSLLDAAMRGGPLTPRDYAVASLIELHPGISASRLAAHLSVPLTTVMEWLAHLIDAGLVERQRDPDDRRRQRLRLTPAATGPMTQARARFGRAYLEFLEHTGQRPEETMAVLRDLTAAARAATTALESDG